MMTRTMMFLVNHYSQKPPFFNADLATVRAHVAELPETELVWVYDITGTTVEGGTQLAYGSPAEAVAALDALGTYPPEPAAGAKPAKAARAR